MPQTLTARAAAPAAPTAAAAETAAQADGLAALERELARQLAQLNLPAAHWPATRTGPDGAPMADVIIVGAGMCGLAAAIGLMFKGVRNIRLLDRSPAGREGPWVTFARMETLRSPKHLTGPAMGVPALTFRAWYEAQFGADGWAALGKIANATWMAYLAWLRRVLALPVDNDVEVEAVEPAGGALRLRLRQAGAQRAIHARRVVWATGRAGAGGLNVPGFVSPALWPDLAAHTAEAIDFARLAGRRVAVLGAGASAWDNAATALEAGAARVDMYVRRPLLPQVNKSRGASYPGFFLGYGSLPDAERWGLMRYFAEMQAPPPHETVQRTLRQGRFEAHFSAPVTAAERRDGQVALRIAGATEDRTADFLIVGTGFLVDIAQAAELAALQPHVATWGDRYTPPPAERADDCARAPYLGPGFELTERAPGAAPDIGRLHLFNHAATASHGALSGDIPGVVIGAERLTSAIAQAIFREDLPALRRDLDAFAEPELQGTPYFAL